MGFARQARERPLGRLGVIDVTAAYRAVSLHFDSPGRDRAAIASMLTEVNTHSGFTSRTREIPCCYEMGEDLEWVARQLELKPMDVVAAHASATYTVYALGFIPGFAYMGWLPTNLAGLPRRESPAHRRAGGERGHGRQADGGLPSQGSRWLAPDWQNPLPGRPARGRLVPSPSWRQGSFPAHHLIRVFRPCRHRPAGGGMNPWRKPFTCGFTAP